VTIAAFEPFEEFSEKRPRFAGWLAAHLTINEADLRDWKRGEFEQPGGVLANDKSVSLRLRTELPLVAPN